MLARLVHASLVTLCLVCISRAEDRFFDSAGVKIRYVVEGAGEPVILVHGFTANIETQWGGIRERLARQYQVVALDDRGHGKSDKPHDPKQYGVTMADDVLRLMDQVGARQAHLVGYSMGGFITSYLLATHPDRLLTATLGGAGWRKANDPRLGGMNELAESLDAGKGIGPLIEMLTPAGQPKPSVEQIQTINQMILLSNDSKALAACIRGLDNLTVTEVQLKANKVPTLALIGESDPLKLGVDEMAAVMANLKVDVIPGADHMTAFTQPQFIDDLLKFLEAHSQKVPAAAR